MVVAAVSPWTPMQPGDSGIRQQPSGYSTAFRYKWPNAGVELACQEHV